MKFLCLAYGDQDGWNSLGKEEQRDALAQDSAIRARGNEMAAVQQAVTNYSQARPCRPHQTASAERHDDADDSHILPRQSSRSSARWPIAAKAAWMSVTIPNEPP